MSDIESFENIRLTVDRKVYSDGGCIEAVKTYLLGPAGQIMLGPIMSSLSTQEAQVKQTLQNVKKQLLTRSPPIVSTYDIYDRCIIGCLDTIVKNEKIVTDVRFRDIHGHGVLMDFRTFTTKPTKRYVPVIIGRDYHHGTPNQYDDRIVDFRALNDEEQEFTRV